MRGCPKSQGEQPDSMAAFIKIQADHGDYDEKEEGMGEYPAVAEGFAEEKLPGRFINNVR